MISVIIPTYNRAGKIMRSVESVLNQTYRDIELIIVDDCSKDNTVEVLHKVQDDRLRVIRLEQNSGACVARNTGIEAAKGEYIAFQDSDDAWHLEKLEKQLDALEKNGADVVFCRMKPHTEETEGFEFKTKLIPEIPAGFVDKRDLIMGSKVSTQTILAKREVFENEKFSPDMPRLQDYELVVRLCQKYKFYLVDDVLVDLYLQDDSLTRTPTFGIALQMLIEKNRDMLSKDKVSWEWLCNRLGNHFEYHGKSGRAYFMEAYRCNHNAKYLLKVAMSLLGLFGKFKKRQHQNKAK